MKKKKTNKERIDALVARKLDILENENPEIEVDKQEVMNEIKSLVAINKVETARVSEEKEKKFNVGFRIAEATIGLGGLGLSVVQIFNQRSLMREVLEYEKTGTICSSIGRNLISSIFRFRK